MIISPWFEERIDELRRRWLAGETAASIAGAMEFTKSAIVGKAHRLGLPSRPSPIARNGAPAHNKDKPRTRSYGDRVGNIEPVKRQTGNGELIKPELTGAAARAVKPVASGRVRECQWPLWGNERPGPTPRFCCAPATQRSYCETHFAVCHVETTRQEAREGTSPPELAASGSNAP